MTSGGWISVSLPGQPETMEPGLAIDALADESLWREDYTEGSIEIGGGGFETQLVFFRRGSGVVLLYRRRPPEYEMVSRGTAVGESVRLDVDPIIVFPANCLISVEQACRAIDQYLKAPTVPPECTAWQEPNYEPLE